MTEALEGTILVLYVTMTPELYELRERALERESLRGRAQERAQERVRASESLSESEGAQKRELTREELEGHS